MWRCIFFLERCQYLVDRCLADVYQHVSVREALHSADLIALQRLWNAVQGFATIVLLQHFTISHRSHTIVVKLEPSRVAIWLNQSKVVPAIHVTRMHQNAMELVHPVLRLGWTFVDKFSKVNFKREFVTIVNLQGKPLSVSKTCSVRT